MIGQLVASKHVVTNIRAESRYWMYFTLHSLFLFSHWMSQQLLMWYGI